METTLVHGELYERTTVRRGCISLLLLLLIGFSLWKADVIGVLLLLFFVFLYAWYEWKTRKDEYYFEIAPSGVTIGKKLFAREKFEGYSMGYKLHEEVYHTLHLYTTDGKSLIFTLNGPQSEIKDIAELLATQIELISPPRTTPLREIMRFLRI